MLITELSLYSGGWHHKTRMLASYSEACWDSEIVIIISRQQFIISSQVAGFSLLAT